MKKYMVSGLIAALFFLGCVAAPPPLKPLVYPRPPEEPRIAYVTSYGGVADFRESSIFDSIFGVPSGNILNKPYGVSAHKGDIYVADTAGAAVIIVEPQKKQFRFIASYNGETSLVSPFGVAVSDDGTIFVSDIKLKEVFVFNDKGEGLRIIGKKDDFNVIGGIAVNSQLGRLYIPDSYNSCVYVYSVQGERLFSFGKPGSGNGEFRMPSNVAVDRRTGNVYVTDTQNFRVQVFDKDGKFLRKFGELGDYPGAFSRPKGVGVDSEGHVYVADAAFDNFQIFDEEGNLLLFVGGSGNGRGQFSLPAGLYVDENDMIYVADSMNRRVNVFQYLSEKWKKDHPEEYMKYLQKPEKKEQEN